MTEQLLRHRCDLCNHWTVTRLTYDGGVGILRCMHCGGGDEFLMTDAEAVAYAAQVRQWVRLLERRFPELKTLRAPGDHIALEIPPGQGWTAPSKPPRC